MPTGASPLGWKGFAVAAAAAAIATTAFAVVLRLNLGGPSFVTDLDDIGEAVAALIAAAACAWNAARATGKFRRGWALLSASAAAWCAGQIVWTIYEVVLAVPVPVPSLADAGFLSAVPLAIAGVYSFFTAPRGTAERWRLMLDGLNIVLALTFTSWALGLKEVELGGGSVVERAFTLAYPIGDILIGTVLVLAIRRATRFQHGRMLLLLGGLAAIAFSDSLFAYMTATGSYLAVNDTGWVAGYLMIALTALWPAGRADAVADRGPIDLWQVALPWMVVLTAAASALVVLMRGERNDQFETVLAVGMGVTMIVNQVLTYRDFMAMIGATRQSQAVLSEVVTRAPIGIARADPRFKIIGANPGLGELLHEDPDALVGVTLDRYIPADAQGQVFEKLDTLASGEAQAVEGECPLARSDGSLVWSHWTSTAIKNAIGQVDYYLTTLEDIDARHRAEEAAKASLATLERLNRLKTDFLNTVSHEIKTALVGIQGFSEFMRDTDDLNVREVRTFAGDIYNNADRLDRMVTEMVELDRAETARVDLVIGPADMNAIIRAEVDDLKKGLDGVTVVTNLDPALPLAAGDGERLADVVHVLLSNAQKYTPDGGQITVSSRASHETVVVSVCDQGIGLRADFDNRLFDAGDLYANNPIRKIVGTGLGLGIARQIVEMHGGRFWVDRHEGVGSEFHFSVPVAEPAQPELAEPERQGGKVA